jgi:hypothetical protein
VADHGAGLVYVRLRPGREESTRRLSVTRIVAPETPLVDMRENLIEELEVRGVLPFARDHLRLIHSPHDGRPATDGRGDPVADFGPDTAMRLPMDDLFQSSAEPSLGVGLLPHSSGIKNMYFASRLNLPGLGLEGEYAAGLAAAGMIATNTRAGIARPFVGRAH